MKVTALVNQKLEAVGGIAPSPEDVDFGLDFEFLDVLNNFTQPFFPEVLWTWTFSLNGTRGAGAVTLFKSLSARIEHVELT